MKPHVLITETTGFAIVAQLQSLGWGRMYYERKIEPFPYEKWGLDNGAFDAWQHKTPWDGILFESRVQALLDRQMMPYIACTPDIVANGCESLPFSLSWIKRLPRDWPWYLAVQDGMQVEEVEENIHLFYGIFLGGTDKFKLQAYRWCRLAHKHQKKFHYARAGTPKRLRHAIKIGADSLDSSFPLWTKARFAEFVAHWQHDSPQMEMAHAR
jgi:hypothetical protein